MNLLSILYALGVILEWIRVVAVIWEWSAGFWSEDKQLSKLRSQTGQSHDRLVPELKRGANESDSNNN